MKIHELKCEGKWYARLLDGTKTAEIRINDRDFKAGDFLILQLTENGKPVDYFAEKGVVTHGVANLILAVTHVLKHEDHEGIANGYAMLSLRALGGYEGRLLREIQAQREIIQKSNEENARLEKERDEAIQK